MSNEVEQRYSHNNTEIRAVGEGEKRTIGGYAVKYNSPTVITDRWGDQWLEEFATGAFDESIATRTQKALWNHDTSKPLGSCKANTLRFNPDVTGLNYDVDVPNNTWGNDAYESVQRGDVDGSSFGFRALDDAWGRITYEGKEMLKRSIIKAELFEVSPCTFPAYGDSEISCRSKDSYKKDEEKRAQEIATEKELRERLRLRNQIKMKRGN
ncbi:MAG: HK97 family phage prohead protease [Clostridiales bacterium]|nr:HK97 family phage prohead protease [Clostridiales bacterium]